MDKLKLLLADPKKARLALICSLAALFTLAAVVVYIIYVTSSGPSAGIDGPAEPSEAASAVPSEPEPVMGMTPTKTLEEAREIALTDAGIAASQAEFSRAVQGEDHGIWVYQFTFQARNAKYEYQINANTGAVYSKYVETYVAATPAPEAAEPPEPSPDTESPPPEETAPQTSPGPESAPPAVSQPPSSPPESSPSPSLSQPSSMYIGMEQAKTIALNHAGLAASQVRFTHVGMDREDGRMVYEVDFRQGQVEYEYEIDASTGRILEHERDAD